MMIAKALSVTAAATRTSWALTAMTAETPGGELSDGIVLLLEPRERVVIDPLEVPEAAAIVVDAKVDPAFLAVFPSSRAAVVISRPADPSRDPERRQANTTTAPITFEHLYPGRWLTEALVYVDDTYSVFEIDDFELKAGETPRRDGLHSRAVHG